MMYEYAAEITRVIDGDTFDARIDLGFRCHTEQRFRLLGYDAPEMRGETARMGRLAKDAMAAAIFSGTVTLRTQKGDSFGRWLASVLVQPSNPDQMSFDLVDRLVRDGWGQRWDARGARPQWNPRLPYPNP